MARTLFCDHRKPERSVVTKPSNSKGLLRGAGLPSGTCKLKRRKKAWWTCMERFHTRGKSRSDMPFRHDVDPTMVQYCRAESPPANLFGRVVCVGFSHQYLAISVEVPPCPEGLDMLQRFLPQNRYTVREAGPRCLALHRDNIIPRRIRALSHSKRTR